MVTINLCILRGISVDLGKPGKQSHTRLRHGAGYDAKDACHLCQSLDILHVVSSDVKQDAMFCSAKQLLPSIKKRP